MKPIKKTKRASQLLKQRRLVRVDLPEELMHDGPVKINGLPSDAELVRIEQRVDSLETSLYYAHEDFKPVAEGAAVPVHRDNFSNARMVHIPFKQPQWDKKALGQLLQTTKVSSDIRPDLNKVQIDPNDGTIKPRPPQISDGSLAKLVQNMPKAQTRPQSEDEHLKMLRQNYHQARAVMDYKAMADAQAKIDHIEQMRMRQAQYSLSPPIVMKARQHGKSGMWRTGAWSI